MKMKTTIAVIVVLALIVIAIIWSAKQGTERAGREFNIGFNEWVGFAPFFLAKEKGYFDDMQVNLHFIADEGDKRAGLYSGRLDMICETIDMFQTNRDTPDYRGVVTFAIDESYGGDGVVASQDIKSVTDLKGISVGAEPGQPAYFILQYLLNKEGLTFSDIKLQDMNSSDAAAAFIAGRVNAAGTYEPYLSDALNKRKGAHLLVSSKDMPGMILDVAIVNEQKISQRKKGLETIYDGWCRAIDYLRTNPEEAVGIMARAFKLTSEEFKETISGLRYFGYNENTALFGKKDSESQIVTNFRQIGFILQKNKLTKEVAAPTRKISWSVVSTRS